MATNVISTGLYRAVRPRQRAALADDPLDAMRGILLGTLISVSLFWLPLALLFAAR